MPIGIPRPTGKSVRDLHSRLEKEWRPRFRLDEEFRDLVHQRNKIEVLEESDDQNMEPMEIHCVDVETPILTRDLRWEPAGSLDVGDKLLAFSEGSSGLEPQFSFRTFEDAIVTYTGRKIVYGYVVSLDDGEDIRCTGEHQFLVTQPSKKNTHWRRVDELYSELIMRSIPGMRPKFELPKYFNTWSKDNSREAGYLAGAFDADGTLTLGKARYNEVVVKFSQYKNDCLTEVKRCLDVLGFSWGESIIDEPSFGATESSHILTIKGGIKENMRFLGIVRPPRLLQRWSKYATLNKKKFSTSERVCISNIRRDKVEVAVLSSSSQTYISAGFGSHNSGRAGGIIEHAGGLLMARPNFHAEPPTLNTADEREAERVERAAANVFEEQLVGNNFWPAVGRDILIYGRAFMKSMLAMSQWTAQAGYPVRDTKESDKKYLMRVRKWKDTEGKFPFVIAHIPALSVLPMLDNGDNVLATIEVKYATAKVLAEDFGSVTVQDLMHRRVIKWYDELPIIEYIDTEWVSYLLGGTNARDRSIDQGVTSVEGLYVDHKSYEPLRTWKHNLGKHPVVLIPGIRTELSDYRSHFKGFLADAKDALYKYDFLLSRLATMVNAYYLPSYEWKLSATSAQFSGRDRPVLRVNLGGVTVTYADENLDVLAIPQGLPDATLLLSQVDDIIQRHTLEDVLFGRVQGAAPAYQVNLRINVAKSKLSPLSQNMAIGVTEVMELFLRSIIQLREAVVIGGEKITVKMAKQYLGRLSTSIVPKSPVDRSQDLGTANLALQFGMPWDWIVENILDIEDPATLRLMKDIQELEELPPVKERLMQDALDQLEALIEEDEMEELGGDVGGLPPEFADAARQLIEGGGEAGQTGAPGLGNAPAPAGLGKGPFPPGSAPQTVNPRGLGTPNTQPVPPVVTVGEEV